MGKPHYELMSSHVHKLIKLAEAQSKVASLSADNESLPIQIFVVADEAKKDKDKDRLKTLEKNIDIKKSFSKLKDKKIDKALMKVEKVDFEAVEKFKASDEFSDKLCDYYMDGFNLFRKYLAKHHLELDFSQLDMEEVEKEILADRPSKAVAENEVVPSSAESIPTDPSPSSLP
nr:hypothetical protein CFP56_72318 [Quercus suber]